MYDADARARAAKGNPAKLPQPTDEQRVYIVQGRLAETARATRLWKSRRDVIRARVVAAATLIIAVVVASLIGTTAANQVNVANTQLANANATVTPIPSTLTAVAQQVQNSQGLNLSLQLAARAVRFIGTRAIWISQGMTSPAPALSTWAPTPST